LDEKAVLAFLDGTLPDDARMRETTTWIWVAYSGFVLNLAAK